jgi:hypothetical protein
MIAPLLSLLLLATSVARGTANQCTDTCDMANPTGMPITFCGIDGKTYIAFYDAVQTGHCYIASCLVTPLYQGVCGCPNECNELFGRGMCSSNGCECVAGWGGQDCSLPVKGNPCSFHGKLIETSDKDSKFPFDYCDCDSGWTGTDCSTEKLDIGNAPWGTVFEDVQVYSKEDEYGDDHPIFNIEKLPTIRMEVSDKNFSWLIAPENLYSGQYVSTTFHWDNGKDQLTLKDVGMKIKGQSSIEALKKGFSVKFNEFVSGQKLYDMKKLGLKPGFDPDDVFVKNLLYYDLMRASGGPAQRESLALLYVNDFFYGLTILAEDIDELFVQRRFPAGDDGAGSFFKMHSRVSLSYFGDNVSYYQAQAKPTDMNTSLPYYDPVADTPEAWADLVDFLRYFNETATGAAFEEEAENYLDLAALLRNMPVEALLLGSDNFASRNNYYLYHYHPTSSSSGKQNTWRIFYYDFDDSMSFCPSSSLIPCEEGDVFRFFDQEQYRGDLSHFNPVLAGILASPRLTDQYAENLLRLLDEVFGSDSKQQPRYRCSRLGDFVSAWVAHDRLWQISNGVTAETFSLELAYTLQHLDWRAQDVRQQLLAYQQRRRAHR